MHAKIQNKGVIVLFISKSVFVFLHRFMDNSLI
jgi:hypothetical protein